MRHAEVLSSRPLLPPNLFALRSAAELAGELSETRILKSLTGKLAQLQQHYPSTRSSGFFYQASGLLANSQGRGEESGRWLERAYRVWPDLSITWCYAEHQRRQNLSALASPLYEQIASAKGTALRFDAVILWICSLAMSGRCFCVLKDHANALKRVTQFRSHWDLNTGLKLVSNVISECSRGIHLQ